jgi:uncharacterized protein
MKKKLLIILLLLVFITPNYVFASTNILERDDTLNVWDEIDKDKYKNDILNTPRVDETEKVYDYANLFSEEEEKKLFDDIQNYIEKYKMDFAIVTIDKNNKSTTERYGEDFYIFNHFGFEDKKRSGSLFIIDMDQRNYHLITSGSMILYLDDKRVDDILDSVFDYIKNGKYYDGCKVVLSKLDSYGTSVPSSNEHVIIGPDGTPHKAKRPSILLSFILASAVAIFYVIINVSKHKGIKTAVDANSYLDTKKINIYKKSDRLISTHTSVVKIPKDPPMSTGGHSGGSLHLGGSSFHSGGGGHSFGGGGRHF